MYSSGIAMPGTIPLVEQGDVIMTMEVVQGGVFHLLRGEVVYIP